MPDAHFGIKFHKSLCSKTLQLQCYKNKLIYEIFKVVSKTYELISDIGNINMISNFIYFI